MLRLSIPARHALARLTLPVMLLMAVGLVLAGRADRQLGSGLRTGFDNALAPLYIAAGRPIRALEHDRGAVGGWFRMHAENQKLRSENERLRRWRSAALVLAAQNAALKSELHFVPASPPDFFTARVIADTGGLYARSVLVTTPQDGVSVINAVAMDGSGLVGRVVEAGDRSARVLLITDINSRVPVSVGVHGEHALMAGANTDTPHLIYWPPGDPPLEGAVVLTSAAGSIFPSGLPVGTIHYIGKSDPVVLPFAGLDRLRLLRLFEYPHSAPVLLASGKNLPSARRP